MTALENRKRNASEPDRRETMKKIEITINGKAYPCRQTMGAMLRFKRETGREITDTDGGLSDMCAYLWCCVASASKADGVEFGMTLIDFADSISPEDLQAWAAAVNEGQEPDGGDEKKSRQASTSS